MAYAVLKHWYKTGKFWGLSFYLSSCQCL